MAKNRSTPVRQRPYELKSTASDTGTTSNRATLVTPSKGMRIRLVNLRLIQLVADGRHILELYFGTGANILTNPDKAIDTLVVADLGSVNGRVYLRGEGAMGERDEVLSCRFTAAPGTGHRVHCEYSEEP